MFVLFVLAVIALGIEAAIFRDKRDTVQEAVDDAVQKAKEETLEKLGEEAGDNTSDEEKLEKILKEFDDSFQKQLDGIKEAIEKNLKSQ